MNSRLPTVSVGKSENRLRIPTISVGNRENRLRIPTVEVGNSKNLKFDLRITINT
jgi:hypothetical protein